LGETPLASALLSEADLAKPEAKFPLNLVFCPSCTLVQTAEDTEHPRSAASADTLKEAEALATKLAKDRKLKTAVVAVASVAKDLADKKDIDVLHTTDLLTRVADLNGVVAGFAAALKDEGVVVVECPWLKDVVDHCALDTLNHEHLSSFSLHALDALFTKNGFVVQEVEKLPGVQGGSIRVVAVKKGKKSKSVTAMLAEEKKAGLDTKAYYEAFATRVAALKAELVATLEVLSEQGARVAAYGAVNMGATLANFVGMNTGLLAFFVDTSKDKQGRYMPGTRQPILPPSALVDKQADFCFLFSWSSEAEILEQEKAWRDRGGQFIVPIPNVRFV